jgi:hypothetical protein
MSDLKLIALDVSDLNVLSTHLQDAVLRVGDMVYQQRQRRFVAIANRFDWSQSLGKAGKSGPLRRQTAIRFERVLDAKVSGVDLRDKRASLALLAITFEPSALAVPDGRVTLTFSGGALIRLSVECLEVQLKDLGAAWAAKTSPEHPDDER